MAHVRSEAAVDPATSAAVASQAPEARWPWSALGLSSPPSLLQLQRTHGNRYVQRLLHSGPERESSHAHAGRPATANQPHGGLLQRCGGEQHARYVCAEGATTPAFEEAARMPAAAMAAAQRMLALTATTAVARSLEQAEEADTGVGQLPSGATSAAPAGRGAGAGPRVQRLTAEEKQQDLTSLKFAGNPRLEKAFDNSPPLGIGESGEAVRLVQEGLVDDGIALPGSTKPTGELDGGFGQDTLNGVRQFQAKHGLDVDGRVGRQTLGKLDELAATTPAAPPGQPPVPVPPGLPLPQQAPPTGGPGLGPTLLGAGPSGPPSPCPAGLIQGPGRCCLRGNTPPPLIYDTSAVRIAPLAPGQKTADVQKEIDRGKAATPPALTTSTVTGVAAGTQEEAFVTDVLRQLATRDRWCTEIDVVAAIGQADQQGKVPSGQVTVRIDGRGNATAELVSRGPLRENAVEDFFETSDPAFLAFIEQLKKLTILRLMTTFKLSDVKEEHGKTWKIGELNKVEQAFARLKPEDVVALEGVDLIRTDKISDPNDPTKELSGLFSHEEKAATGGAPASRSASIRLADLAFAGDRVSFVGDKADAAPGSFQTILHEVGHAVETKAQRDAIFSDLEATATLNAANGAVTTAVNNSNSATGQARANRNAYSRTNKRAMVGYENAFNGVITALNQFGRSTAAQSAAQQLAAVQAIARRDAQRTRLQRAAPSHPALTDFAQAETRQDEWLEAAKARVAPQAASEQAQAARARTEVTRGGQSRRLQNFVTFVTRNRIDPVTDYARTNWPNHPEEFFAEAYSLWLNDPTFLRANAPLLFDWFEQGQHRV